MNRGKYLILVVSIFLVYTSMTCKSEEVAKGKTSGTSGSSEQGKETGGEKPQMKDTSAVVASGAPRVMYGLYINNANANNSRKMETFIQEAKKYGFNAFIMDVQRGAGLRMMPPAIVQKIKDAGIFTVARVVVFPGGGLMSNVVPDAKISSVIRMIEESHRAGFQEVQLDYIRYADDARFFRLGLDFKYKQMERIMKPASEKAKELGVRLGADVFGRVSLNRNDHIGQKLENFAIYMDVIYPMLYPSHYGEDRKRMSNPYETVKGGVAESKKRIPQTKIIAYIQGFDMRIGYARMGLSDYIYEQMRGVRDGDGDGWVIWNANNVYGPSFTALEKLTAQGNGK